MALQIFLVQYKVNPILNCSLAYGTDYGIAIVDIVQHVLVTTLLTSDLYGTNDPFSRPVRPNNDSSEDHDQNGAAMERALETVGPTFDWENVE